MIEPIYIPFENTVLKEGRRFLLYSEGKPIASVLIKATIIVSLMEVTKTREAFTVKLSHTTPPGAEKINKLSFGIPDRALYRYLSVYQEGGTLTIQFHD